MRFCPENPGCPRGKEFQTMKRFIRSLAFCLALSLAFCCMGCSGLNQLSDALRGLAARETPAPAQRLCRSKLLRRNRKRPRPPNRNRPQPESCLQHLT